MLQPLKAWITDYERTQEKQHHFLTRPKKETTVSMTAKETGNREFEIAPEGTYTARCYKMIDLGTQPVEWQGKTKHQQKLLVAWELLTGDKMADGRPFMVQKRYTNSLSEKSALRPDLEVWRGRAFTPDELAGFNLKAILGAYCLIQIIHNTKGDSTYANIGSLMKLPKEMPKPAPVNDDQFFDLDAPDMQVLESLSEKMQEIIKGSPEWQERIDPAEKITKHATGAGSFDDMTDDIPF